MGENHLKTSPEDFLSVKDSHSKLREQFSSGVKTAKYRARNEVKTFFF